MNAIRIRKRIEPEMVRHLPELKEMIGKDVEIIVLEDTPMPTEKAPAPGTSPDTTPYDAFFELAGTIDYDFDACKELRALDLE